LFVCVVRVGGEEGGGGLCGDEGCLCALCEEWEVVVFLEAVGFLPVGLVGEGFDDCEEVVDVDGVGGDVMVGEVGVTFGVVEEL